jgi:hypothetical protein
MTTKTEKYKITREDRWDDGKIVHTHYQVMRFNRFWRRWVWVKKEVNSWTDSYNSPVTFKTLEEAEEFVKALVSGAKIEGWTTTDIKIYERH